MTASLLTSFSTVLGVWVIVVLSPGPNLFATIAVAGGWYAIVANLVTPHPALVMKQYLRRLISYVSGTLLVGIGLTFIFDD